MRPTLRCAAALLLTLPAGAQTKLQTPGTTPTLRTSTRLVVLDVTVTDSHGSPVRGLPQSAFRLTESRRPQAILTFEEHSITKQALAPPALQPGVFTNLAAAASHATPTILLLDYLNTPRESQTFVRKAMLDYLRTAPSNTRIALFGLNSTLVQLQRFTDDPALLRAAAEHTQPQSSATSNQDSDPDPVDAALSGQVAAQVVANAAADAIQYASPTSSTGASFDLFNATELNVNENQRATMTLRAFHRLALYLAKIPGRKNLIWFSGAFPLSLQPAADVVVPYNGDPDWKAEYRETVDILTRSRVAVYPIDGRGLMLQSSVVANETQAAMYEMADDTGGKAYINTNGLAAAVADIVDKGSDYYTLAYDPTDANFHGEFRPIHLALEDGKGYKLAYRRGYYADTPGKAAAAATAAHLSPVQLAASYMAPTSAQIPFYARVLPIAGSFSVEYSADLQNLATTTTPDGLRHAHLEFIALAYDPEGRVAGSDIKRVNIVWTPQQFAAAMQHGVRYQQQLPAAAAALTAIRLLIHDLTSDHIGSLDVPGTALEQK